MYCFFTVLPVYVLLCAASGVIKNDDSAIVVNESEAFDHIDHIPPIYVFYFYLFSYLL